jgi:hypothetical protein
MTSMKQTFSSFGRRGLPQSGLQTLGDPPTTTTTPSSTADPCSYSSYLASAPQNTDGTPGMKKETEIGIIAAGVGLVGALSGALLGGKHRVRNGAIGAVVGVAGVGVASAVNFSNWKKAGGAAGACVLPTTSTTTVTSTGA